MLGLKENRVRQNELSTPKQTSLSNVFVLNVEILHLKRLEICVKQLHFFDHHTTLISTRILRVTSGTTTGSKHKSGAGHSSQCNHSTLPISDHNPHLKQHRAKASLKYSRFPRRKLFLYLVIEASARCQADQLVL